MFKKIIIMAAMFLMLTACGAKQSDVVSSDLPFGGYKKELEDYERSRAAQKPQASLWADAGTHGTVFLDYKARLVGDVVIVRIVESATASNSNNTSTGKTATYNSSIDSLFGLPLDMGMTNFLGSGNAFDPSIGATTNNSWSGQGTKGKADSLSATIAARVVEVLPSGNLLIEGQREIVIDQEKQTITIKGIVRPKDIDASNMVSSSNIADAQISYSGDGVITDANRKGWLATFVDWVWPF